MLTAQPGVGLGMIDLIDHDYARKIYLSCVLPDAVGHGFDAGLRVEHHQGGFHWQHCGARLVQEHVEAGGVEEVDLDSAPFDEGGGVGHGGAAGYFFFVVSSYCRSILHAPPGSRHLRRLQESCDQCGLTAVRVAHQQRRCGCPVRDNSFIADSLYVPETMDRMV